MLGHREALRQAMTPAPGKPQRTDARYRFARLALVAQGLFTGVLGGVGLAWSMASLHPDPKGIPLIGFMVSPLHGGLFIAAGALAVLACLGRPTTVAFAVTAAAGWTILAVVCAVEVAHHVCGMLGFDPRDTELYIGLALYNLVLCLWLVFPAGSRWRAQQRHPAAPHVIRSAGR